MKRIAFTLLAMCLGFGTASAQKNKKKKSNISRPENRAFFPHELPTVEKEIPQPKAENRPEYVDEKAEFPGGTEALYKEFYKYFDARKVVSNTIKMSTTLSFVVKEDGSISDIQARGDNASLNAETVRAIEEIKTLWKPATLKGKPVRSRVRLPVIMINE